MEESEVPMEEVQEHIHHTARHGHGHGDEPRQRWTMGVAMSTALFAALAAIASLLAGQQANEALAAQIESANSWNYYQAKSIKSNLLETKSELLAALGHESNAKDLAKHGQYETEKGEIKIEAEAKAETAKRALHCHEWLARAVTMFQVAIALAAISLLTKQRSFWMLSLTLGLIGVTLFGYGLSRLCVNGTDTTSHSS